LTAQFDGAVLRGRLLELPDPFFGIVLRTHAQMLPQDRLPRRDSGNTSAVIGKLRSTVIDCRNPRQLATCYAGLLGGTLHEEDDTWVVLTDPNGRRIAFQLSPQHEPPQFPDPHGSQQFHLDIAVDDVASAEPKSSGSRRDTGDRRGRGQHVPRVPGPGGTHVLSGLGYRRGANVTKG
jgi:hypothetical protein